MQDLLMCSPVLATIIKPILPVVKTLMTSFSLRIFCYTCVMDRSNFVFENLRRLSLTVQYLFCLISDQWRMVD
jgi:hypothetical protein